MPCVYFDYNATTPLDSGVRDAMRPYLEEVFGNPSSVHQLGRRARADLDNARDRLAALWCAKPSEVIFTSGGTESNNLALMGAARLRREKGRHIVTSAIEHHSVLHPVQYLARREGFELTFVPADSAGRVDPSDVGKALRAETILVSVMSVNNETGVRQPVSEIGAICRENGVLFHCDASQYFGKAPFQSIHQFNADLVTLCAHKFYGPKGAGALFIRSPLLPDPILFGGGHENERRAGTENLAGVIGLVEACSLFLKPPVFTDALGAWSARLEESARRIPGVAIQGDAQHRVPNTVSFTVEGTDSISLMAGLDLQGVCASSGSACSAGSLEPSHVLLGMGVAPKLANSFVRLSLGRENTQAEVDYAASILPRVIGQVRTG